MSERIAVEQRWTPSRRWPSLGLSVLGVALFVSGLSVPAYESLLFAWAGTAMFGAVLVALFGPTATVRADVATDVYTALAGTCRALDAEEAAVYRPTDDGVRLGEMVPTGSALVDRIGTATVSDPQSPAAHLHVLIDGLVEELELVSGATAEVEDGAATVTVEECRFGTAELYDHPVASVLGVGLARATDAAVTVDATPQADGLVISCAWQPADETAPSVAPAAEETED